MAPSPAAFVHRLGKPTNSVSGLLQKLSGRRHASSASILRERVDADDLGEFCHLGALLVNRLGEFLRAADIEELAGDGETVLDRVVGDGSDIGGDAVAQFER